MMEKKPSTSSGKSTGKYLVAQLFILVGVLMFARNMDWIDGHLYRTLVSWQMLLIVIGLYSISRRNVLGGLVLLAVGGCLLLPRLNLSWLPVSTGALMWPLVLVMIGLFFLTRPRRGGIWRNKTRDSFACNECNTADGFVNSENLFGGVKQVVLDEVFKGASIRNNFGGTVLDLRRTGIAEGETYIDLECTFGGVEIYVPSDWKVSLQASAILGGCEDKRLPGININQSRILVVRGNVMFGGVEIKS